MCLLCTENVLLFCYIVNAGLLPGKGLLTQTVMHTYYVVTKRACDSTGVYTFITYQGMGLKVHVYCRNSQNYFLTF